MSKSQQEILEEISASDAALVIGTPCYLKRVESPGTRTALEFNTLLARAKHEPDKFQFLPILHEGLLLESFPQSVRDYLVRDCRNMDAYEDQMSRRLSPPGLLPDLLGVGVSEEYQKLLKRYKWSTLTHLPPENPQFRSREINLASLAYNFNRPGADTPTSQTICGLTGVGKSELAFAYAHRYRKHYVFCYWLVSETKEQLILSLRTLALRLGIDLEAEGSQNQDVWISALYQYLSAIKSWLLIFDNAPSRESISSYLPPQQQLGQHILITSRDADLLDERLQALTPAESIDLLAARLSFPRGLKVDELLRGFRDFFKALGGLPLALINASACLVVCSGLDVKSYLRLLGNAQQQMRLLEKHEDADELAQVAPALLISLEFLKQQFPGSLVLLMALAYLAAEDIPLALCGKIVGGNAALREALEGLRRFSLIGDSACVNHIKINRLVQIITQKALSVGFFGADPKTKGPYEARSILGRLRVAIESYYTSEDPKESRKAKFTRVSSLLPHIKTLLAHYDQQNSSGAPIKRMKVQQVAASEALAAKPAILGASDRSDEFYFLEIVAELHGLLGEVMVQKDLLEDLLRLKQAYYGDDHISLVRVLISLAHVLRDLDSVDEFREREIALLEQALRIEEQRMPQNQEKIAEVLGSLAVSYSEIKNLEKSKILYQKALQLEGSCHGQVSLDMAISLENLSKIYCYLAENVDSSDKGAYLQKAKRLLNRVLRSKCFYYGGQHPEIILTLLSLSDVHIALNDFIEGKDIIECALKISWRYYGLDHSACVCVLLKLANASRGLEDHALSQESLLKEAMRINNLNYRESDKRKLPALINLGMMYQESGDLAKSVIYLEQALAIYAANPKISYADRVGVLRALAFAYRSLGQTANQIKVLEELTDVKNAALVPKDFLTEASSQLVDAYGILEGGDQHHHQQQMLP
jgi:tetratricopeptide (TPR) repeat protein